MMTITNSENETFEYAKKFAKNLIGGEIIGLKGDLGAGKTVFTKGIAASLGVKENVNSPTFVIMKIYELKNKTGGIKKLIHIDAYRLKKNEEIKNLGIEDFINKDNLIIIEWPENINIKTNRDVLIKAFDKTKRKIYIN